MLSPSRLFWGGTPVKLQRELRDHLRQLDPDAVHTEPWCSCGSSNHARIYLFRLDSQPVTAIVPEACQLTAAMFAQALPGSQVQPLSEGELDIACDEGELGRMNPFENPFGAAVYLDEQLARHDTIVFCPRMFSGRKGQCYRVPTRQLLAAVNPVILCIALEEAAVAAESC